MLKEITGTEKDLQLADVFGIPAGTIATWKQRDLTPYELILRTCLAYNLNLEALALGKGELYKNDDVRAPYAFLPAKRLHNNKLVDLESVALDLSFLSDELSRENCLVVFSNVGSYLVNTDEISPTSGNYLIDVDGVFSINKVRRLPGKKLSVDFDGSLIDVAEGDIKVIGRVAMSMVKG
ncbi:Bacteriophage CI repressor helix-turn-helix domain [Grimontia hollisae]|nr:Bacteriophage CI repressor helix-turn-helix domain [Grimontia hollisae]